MRTLSAAFAACAALVFLAAPAHAEERLDSGDIPPGGSFVFTFKEVHEEGHSYHCHPHPWMVGMVHVGPDSDGSTRVHTVRITEGADQDDWGYSVEHLYIEVGDTVVWANEGAAVHTVTGVDSLDGHVHHDHDGHDHGDEDASGPAAVALLLLVGLAAALRRR